MTDSLSKMQRFGHLYYRVILDFKTKKWSSPDRPDELVIITHWASLEQWQAIPKDVLDRTTQRFQQAMGVKYSPEVTGFRLLWRSDENH